mgnify:FL=1
MCRRLLLPVILAAFVAVSCDQTVPTATGDSTSDAATALMKSDGNNGAVRWIPDPECAVFDGDGNPVFVDCRNQIATYSKNGNAVAVIQATGVPNSTGQVVKWDAWNPPQVMLDWYEFAEPPVPCYVIGPDGGALFTLKWKAMVTPGGHDSLICHYSHKWEFQWPD